MEVAEKKWENVYDSMASLTKKPDDDDDEHIDGKKITQMLLCFLASWNGNS